MTPQLAMPLAVALPLVGVGLIVLARHRPNLREAMTLITAVALFAVVLSILPAVARGERPQVVLFEMFPGIALAFSAEPLGAAFAAIASFLWIVTSVYSIGYMRGHHEPNQTRFYVFFAVALATTMGVAFSANLLTLFTFYEALTVCTFPLVTHAGTDAARRAGRVYLGILLGTSIGFQLFAIVATAVIAGTLDFTDGGILAGRASDGMIAFLLALYVFGIGKAALMPFHRWLPAAMVAPTPVSALLHAVAVVKAGVFTVLKVTVYVFGIDLLATTGAGLWLAYVAAATILIGSLVAMTKDNLKARLAYSTVSQLSYVVLGAMLATAAGVTGGAMHIAMHAFGKITLFFCAGAILVASHETEISRMRGLGRRMPFTFAAFFVAALSIIGLPPLGGAWSKFALIVAAVDTGQLVLVAVLMLSSLLNIAYLVPVAIRGFLPAPATPAGTAATGLAEAPLLCVVPLWLTAIGCVVLFFYADHLYDFLRPLGGG
ncbi:MAG: proton-conducting transporter membrane subunit [Rhodospirillales bacterium]